MLLNDSRHARRYLQQYSQSHPFTSAEPDGGASARRNQSRQMNPQIVQQSHRFSSLMHGLTPGQPDESGNGRMGHWDAPEVHLIDRFDVVADREVQAHSHTTNRPRPENRPDHRTGFWIAPDLNTAGRSKDAVDVIAIHGVGAHPIDTWTHRAKDTNWLIDERMLRHDVPNSRVMIYGYESQWKGPESLTVTITNIAHSFVTRLIAQREHSGKRPMIFVAHCFGGIVLIKAMNILKDKHPDVLKAVAGLVFFGTPFRGVNGAMSNGQLVERARQQDGQEVRPEILNVLKEDDGYLQDILQQFINLSRAGAWSPVICCYTEMKPASVWRIVDDRHAAKEIVVKESSARLDIADIWHALPHDHFSMNKFVDCTDQNYLEVAGAILTIARGCTKRKSSWMPQTTSTTSRPHITPAPSPIPARSSGSEIGSMSLSEPRQPSSPRRPSVFAWHIEQTIPRFTMDNSVQKIDLKCKKAGVKSAFACGVSSDARRVFCLDEEKLAIYTIDAIGRGSVLCSSPPKPPRWKYHSAKMTASFLVATYTSPERSYCRVFRVPEKPDASPECFRCELDEETSADSQFQCVALHQSSSFVLVALAEHGVTGAASASRIHLYKIFPYAAYQPTQHEVIPLDEVQDEEDGESSAPQALHGRAKFLTFSPDGSFLFCCTSVYKQIANSLTVWQITHDLNRFVAQFVCDKIHRYTKERSVLGITSAACWQSASTHPYMFVTTSPSSQRKHNKGEWSFIAPIGQPLPTNKDDAMHCLYKAQHVQYNSIMCSAIASSGNAIAFISQTGKVCVAPLLALTKGGIGTSDGLPMELERSLRTLERPEEADLRFSEDDGRLIAVDTKGTLLIAHFGGR